MKIQLYNTLSGKKEEFKPIKAGVVSMYNCGPTVYDRAHIGNLRAYVFADTLRRMFEYNDFEVKQVMNITDVGHLSGENLGNADQGEDKMTKALNREGLPLTMDAMYKIGTKYFELFKKDLAELNIETPSKFPRASDHVQEDIDLIAKLKKKGFTYVTKDGIYFDTSKFPGYGKLGKIDIASLKAGARVAANPEKKNITDFALWKFDAVSASGPSLGWNSPWGNGFPGWHIECSAMSSKYLGQPFDIHTGGIEHIPVHHNNEIAQSEAAESKPLANYWMHNEHLAIDGSKISKSLGNSISLADMEKEGVSPITYRYWLLTSHYRSRTNFSYEAVRGAENALVRLLGIISSLGSAESGKISVTYKEKFQTFINDDLDTPQAIALIWDLLKDADVPAADKRSTILDFDRVLGLDLAEEIEIPAGVTDLAQAREKARQEKDWKRADALRKEIEAAGFDIMDRDGGFKLRRK